VRIESVSDNNGQYTAHAYFKAKTDPAFDMVLVTNCVRLAERTLPEPVRKEGVTTKVRKAEADPNKVVFAILDRGNYGWEATQNAAGAVVKRLAASALTKLEVFPGHEKLLDIDIDSARCDHLGVTIAEVCKAIEHASPSGSVNQRNEGTFTVGSCSVQTKVAAPAKEVERFKKVVVRDKVTLGDVAVLKAVDGPAAVCRVDGFPAIRITGVAPEEKSVAAAAAQCVDLAEAELKRRDFQGFAVNNLSVK
jgi:multidrug efflux pump subunit AcrB